MWFHSINNPGDVDLIYDYVESMLLAESVLDPPEALATRLFDRYLVQSAPCDGETWVATRAAIGESG